MWIRVSPIWHDLGHFTENVSMHCISEVYLGPYQTFMMKRFLRKELMAILQNIPITDIWTGPKYAPTVPNHWDWTKKPRTYTQTHTQNRLFNCWFWIKKPLISVKIKGQVTWVIYSLKSLEQSYNQGHMKKPGGILGPFGQW